MKNTIIILPLLISSISCTFQKTVFDPGYLEINPGLKLIITEFIDSTQRVSPEIRVFYLTLNSHDEHNSTWVISPVKSMLVVDAFPPISYSIIKDSYVLFRIPFQQQFYPNKFGGRLHNELGKYLTNGIYDPRSVWGIVMEDDIVMEIIKPYKRSQMNRFVTPHK